MLERVSRDPNAHREKWTKVIHSFLEIDRSFGGRGIANQSLFLAGRTSLRLYRRSGKIEDLDRAIRCLYEYTRRTGNGPYRLIGLKELKEAHLLKRKVSRIHDAKPVPASASKTTPSNTRPTASLENHQRPANPHPREPAPARWASVAKAPPALSRYNYTGNPFCSSEAAPPATRAHSHDAEFTETRHGPVDLSPRPVPKERACYPARALSVPIRHNSATGPKIASAPPAPTREALPVVRRIENVPKEFVIVIDPGHGGKDPGAVSKDGRIREKDITLEVANRVKKRLLSTETRIKVEMTRADDKFLTLQERTAFANSLNADLFISLHCNADSDSGSRGVETFYLSKASSPRAMRMAARENGIPLSTMSDLQATLLDLMLTSKKSESNKLANTVHNSLVKNLAGAAPKTRDRGVKRAPFYVLLGAKMPAVLVECAFISNGREERKLTSTRHLESVALGITTGALTYLRELGGKS